MNNRIITKDEVLNNVLLTKAYDWDYIFKQVVDSKEAIGQLHRLFKMHDDYEEQQEFIEDLKKRGLV